MKSKDREYLVSKERINSLQTRVCIQTHCLVSQFSSKKLLSLRHAQHKAVRSHRTKMAEQFCGFSGGCQIIILLSNNKTSKMRASVRWFWFLSFCFVLYVHKRFRTATHARSNSCPSVQIVVLRQLKTICVLHKH